MSDSSPLLCFEVDNFEDAYARDHLAVERAEKALAEAGAIPARVDFPSRTFCVTVTNADLSVENLLSIFAACGLHARVKGGGHDRA